MFSFYLPNPDANLADASRLPKPEANFADAKRLPRPLANLADANRLPRPLANLADANRLPRPLANLAEARRLSYSDESSELKSSNCSSLLMNIVDSTVLKWKRNRTARRPAIKINFVCILIIIK